MHPRFVDRIARTYIQRSIQFGKVKADLWLVGLLKGERKDVLLIANHVKEIIQT
jgi:hypothetical protein